MSLFAAIDIRFADPVCALKSNSNFLVTGSMMGRIVLFNLLTKKTIVLSELSSENISGIDFDSENIFNVVVGDEEVLKYTIDNNHHNYNRFPNYENEVVHKNKCEMMFSLVGDNKLLLLELNQQSETGNININSTSTSLKIKDLEYGNIREYNVTMTNYSVPFDFDGKRFLWVEFLNEKERTLCLYNFDTEQKFEYPLDKEFGHISFARIYEEKILLVKKLNIVEIRNLDEKLTLFKSFVSPGDEVMCMDYFSYVPLNTNNVVEINVNNNNNQIDTKTFIIVLIDIDGNVNYIENLSSCKTKFNMYEVKEISSEVKEKMFFSMGYPYYCEANTKYLTVSTDYGVFVFNNKI